jgi:DNA repair protein RecO (recombination protein O)
MAEKRLMTFQGIVIYQRAHKERDLMVKMLTREGGKRMFYVKNGKSKRYPFAAELQPNTVATYEGVLNDDGLSFIDDVKSAKLARQLMVDVERNAYATYILGLIDAAFVDNQPIPKWFDWAEKALAKLNDDPEFDAQGLANYFEVQLLPAFGITPVWGECAIDGRRDLPLDFSEKFGGTICQAHWDQDEKRMQANPRAVRILSKFAAIDLRQLGSMSLKPETKVDMARIMDKIYDDQVGIHLRSKSFIQQLAGWSARLATRGGEASETD